MIISLYANKSSVNKINLNIKIENLEQFKKTINHDNDFKFDNIDKYIKDNFMGTDLKQDIVKIYGDINKFEENDKKILGQLKISSLNQLLTNDIVKNS